MGSSYNYQSCNTQLCPGVVNGAWSAWSAYGSCSKTCGTGLKTRTRTCTNPAPVNGGRICYGAASSSTSCKDASCPGAIDGMWSVWGSWGTCSVTCARGLRSRTRTCTNPAPANEGDNCVGGTRGYASCNAGKCPGFVDGAWSAWGSWTGCSKTCGVGYNYKRRTCTNPAPLLGGDTCPGQSYLYAVCYNYDSAACPGIKLFTYCFPRF